MNGLILTLILGIFIMIGAAIVFLTKNNSSFIKFSISLAFGVIIMLIFIDIFPEAIEVTDSGNQLLDFIYVLLGSLIGFILLKILDGFIPDHHDHPVKEEEEVRHLHHIGFVSSIALIIHNVVEGMAIYSLYKSDSTAGIMASIGVGLHNIPFGMVIASAFYKSNNDRKKTALIILIISLSTFLGGLLMALFNFGERTKIIEIICLSITLGMLIYISMVELLPKIINSKNKRITIVGLLIGIVLMIGTLFL